MKTEEIEVVINQDGTHAIFVQTRSEAHEQMKLGNKFTATTWRSVSNFNKIMLRFWMKKYKYTKSKLKRGIDLYEIANHDKLEALCDCVYGRVECIYPKCIKYAVGTKHQARIVNKKAVIL